MLLLHTTATPLSASLGVYPPLGHLPSTTKTAVLAAAVALLLATGALAADPQPTPAAAVEATPSLTERRAQLVQQFQQLVQKRAEIDAAIEQTRGRIGLLEELGAK